MKDKQNGMIGIRSEQLLTQIASAQGRLYDKLINVDVKSLNISQYNQRYLKGKIAQLEGLLELYGSLIYLCLSRSSLSPEEFVLVDYGGGIGLISLLAAEMGIGTVIYNDIYEVSCIDAGHLSKILGLTLDHIVCGDVAELVSYLHKNSISINAITSHDVLEHIYNVESHFQHLGCLQQSKLRVVYASYANMKNPRYVRRVKRKQMEAEYKNRKAKSGHKERDSLKAFLDMRKSIISEYAPELTSEQVEQLARSTRGLIRGDIEKCVDEFCLKGSIVYRINHPTNTCDPATGNWCEHLINLDRLQECLHRQGYVVEIMTGKYHSGGSLLKRSGKAAANFMIRILESWGMFIAPYYVVYAESRAEW